MSPALLVHIQAHLDEDLSLAVLSAKASLSPAHFQRTFQALIGETAKNYVARLRLERAAFRSLRRDLPARCSIAEAPTDRFASRGDLSDGARECSPAVECH